MRKDIETRVRCVARCIITTHCTVREAAKAFYVSKSTIHKDMVDRLPELDLIVSEKVKKILDENREERALRGGVATQKMWSEKKVMT